MAVGAVMIAMTIVIEIHAKDIKARHMLKI